MTVDVCLSVLQAPPNMKSVLQAGWLLTVAFGNVIVLIVAEGAGLEQVPYHKILQETFRFKGCPRPDILQGCEKYKHV